MSAARAKKVKMATKSCPQCDQQVPVACKSCPCGYIFISRKLLHGRQTERVPPTSENRSDPKRRRTERIKRERINSTVSRDLENRRRSRSNSQSDPIRRGRGRPKTVAIKKQEEEKDHTLFSSHLQSCIQNTAAGRSGKDYGAEGTAARYSEDVRSQRGDRGSRRQPWMGEEELGKSLLRPYIEERKVPPRTEGTAGLVQSIQQHAQESEPMASTSTSTLMASTSSASRIKRKRCSYCPSSCDNKTSITCSGCQKFLCKAHVYCSSCKNT